MDGSLLRSRWAAIGAAIAVALGGGVVMVARAAESPSPTSFVPVVPCRLMDTRDPGVGPRTVPLGAAETYSAVVWGTNGLPWRKSLAPLKDLGLKDETIERVTRTNAAELFDL